MGESALFLYKNSVSPVQGEYSKICLFLWKCSGLIDNVLNSGSSGLGSSPGLGHCVVFLGQTLNSHSASLHPGVKIGTGKSIAREQPGDGPASHPG